MIYLATVCNITLPVVPSLENEEGVANHRFMTECIVKQKLAELETVAPSPPVLWLHGPLPRLDKGEGHLCYETQHC